MNFKTVFASLVLAALVAAFACYDGGAVRRGAAEAAPVGFAATSYRPNIETPASPDENALPPGVKLGAGVKVEGALICALKSTDTPDTTDYMTLDEAMSLNLCTVCETGVDAADDLPLVEGGHVNGDTNHLRCCNGGDRPLFLMAGDLVLGGVQDRILAESVVIAPHTRNQLIPVFCVEHGRSAMQGRDAEMVSAGKFYNRADRGSCDLAVRRAALVTREQGCVWASVAQSNRSLNVDGDAPTGTFRGTFDNADTRALIESNYASAATVVADDVVGFAVYIEDKLVAMDLFGNPGLTRKLSEKLLRGYIVTGLSGGYTEQALVESRNSRDVSVTFNSSEVIYIVNMNDQPRQWGLEGWTGQMPVQNVAEVNGVLRLQGVELARSGSLRPIAPENGLELEDHALANESELIVRWLGAHGADQPAVLTFEPAVQTQPTLVTGIAATCAPAEDKDRTEATVVNDRTEISREYKKDSLSYQCTDKSTGKAVHRSYLKR